MASLNQADSGVENECLKDSRIAAEVQRMKSEGIILTLVGCLTVLISLTSGASTEVYSTRAPSVSTTASALSTTASALSTTAPSVEDMCRQNDKDCETCVKSAKCLWCKSKPDDETKCIPYPSGKVIPPSSTCPLDQARWGVCWMNYKALLISMAVIGGVLIISSCVCCYCCCCRTNKRKQQKRFAEEDARYERERQERQARADERKSERRSKYDEIRRKYGLIKDDNPYQKFENETA